MVFSFGHGYVAQVLGDVGTSRTPRNENQLLYKGGPFSKEILEALTHYKSILISIPPSEEGDLLIPHIKQEMASFKHIEWIGYLSSTSVYGNHEGDWVDENSATHPSSPQGIARLKAENQWLELDLPIHIFRLAGIYGPGRNVLIDLKAGRARRIFKEGVVFSRIHVDDIIQALKGSMSHLHPGRIYNLADNYPAPSHEVISYAASLLKMDPPPLISYEDAELSPMLRSFYNDSKKVKNERLLKELIPSLLYPTYKEGLQSLLKESL